MTNREKREQRCRLVRKFLESITDDTTRLVCFFYMRGYDDRDICRRLRMKQSKLNAIKLQIAFDMKKTGIDAGRDC